MQVETIYTFKNYLYIVTSGFFSQNKVKKICQILWGRFYKTSIPLALLGYEMLIANLALSIISYPMHMSGIIVKYIVYI